MIILMTVLTFLLAWLGSAAVALVILRNGFTAATGTFMLVLLPVSIAAYAGNVVPLSTLLCSSLLASVLRNTRSWPIVLTILPFVIGLWAITFLAFGREYLDQLLVVGQQGVDLFKEQLEIAAAKGENQEAVEQIIAQMPPLTLEHMLGRLGIAQLLLTLMALFTARWWQAVKYNPGGFQKEFHQLRLQRISVLVLVAGLVLLSNYSGYEQWAWFFAMPIIFAGIALVHGLVEIKKLGPQWLVFFYLFFTVFALAVPLLMMVVIADSALDFRARVARDQTND